MPRFQTSHAPRLSNSRELRRLPRFEQKNFRTGLQKANNPTINDNRIPVVITPIQTFLAPVLFPKNLKSPKLLWFWLLRQLLKTTQNWKDLHGAVNLIYFSDSIIKTLSGWDEWLTLLYLSQSRHGLETRRTSKRL